MQPKRRVVALRVPVPNWSGNPDRQALHWCWASHLLWSPLLLSMELLSGSFSPQNGLFFSCSVLSLSPIVLSNFKSTFCHFSYQFYLLLLLFFFQKASCSNLWLSEILEPGMTTWRYNITIFYSFFFFLFFP